jgi:hypothetical protein
MTAGVLKKSPSWTHPTAYPQMLRIRPAAKSHLFMSNVIYEYFMEAARFSHIFGVGTKHEQISLAHL